MKGRHLHLEKALTPDEMRAVLDVADLRLQDQDLIVRRRGLLAWVLLTTGLRISEAARIRFEDFDLGRNQLGVWRHKKHGQGWSRGIPYSGAVRDCIVIPDALSRRVAAFAENGADNRCGPPCSPPCGPLFVQQHGKPARLSTLRKDWYDLLTEAGIKRRGAHAARHTFGTLVALQTKSPWAVRDALGHSDIGISSQYVDRNPELVRQTVNTIFSEG